MTKNRPPTFRAITVKSRKSQLGDGKYIAYTEIHLFPTQNARTKWIDEYPWNRHKLSLSRALDESDMAEETIVHMTPEEDRDRIR